MKEEDKNLLLRDLCGRLPYGVKMNHIANDEHSPNTLIGIDRDYVSLQSVGGYSYVPVEHYKPYLFPLSSMTEEQKIELNHLSKEECDIVEYIVNNPNSKNVGFPVITYYMVDWCNRNHFDYRGLIPKSLAIDCTNLNIY